jgi:hypothetical protein
MMEYIPETNMIGVVFGKAPADARRCDACLEGILRANGVFAMTLLQRTYSWQVLRQFMLTGSIAGSVLSAARAGGTPLELTTCTDPS